jgi:hypothetical protein
METKRTLRATKDDRTLVGFPNSRKTLRCWVNASLVAMCIGGAIPRNVRYTWNSDSIIARVLGVCSAAFAIMQYGNNVRATLGAPAFNILRESSRLLQLILMDFACLGKHAADGEQFDCLDVMSQVAAVAEPMRFEQHYLCKSCGQEHSSGGDMGALVECMLNVSAPQETNTGRESFSLRTLLLQEWGRSEPKDETYSQRCGCCLKPDIHVQRGRSLHAPRSLTVYIRRNKYVNEHSTLKVTTIVHIPVSLKLEALGLIGPYNLKAVVLHRGNEIASGHYVTVECSGECKDLLVYDDDTVTKLAGSSFLIDGNLAVPPAELNNTKASLWGDTMAAVYHMDDLGASEPLNLGVGKNLFEKVRVDIGQIQGRISEAFQRSKFVSVADGTSLRKLHPISHQFFHHMTETCATILKTCTFLRKERKHALVLHEQMGIFLIMQLEVNLLLVHRQLGSILSNTVDAKDATETDKLLTEKWRSEAISLQHLVDFTREPLASILSATSVVYDLPRANRYKASPGAIPMDLVAQVEQGRCYQRDILVPLLIADFVGMYRFRFCNPNSGCCSARWSSGYGCHWLIPLFSRIGRPSSSAVPSPSQPLAVAPTGASTASIDPVSPVQNTASQGAAGITFNTDVPRTFSGELPAQLSAHGDDAVCTLVLAAAQSELCCTRCGCC